MSNQKYLIIVAGPTASGKTALSVDFALHFEAEIISCDSRQFYREMNIGTAKPEEKVLASVKHHFVDCMSIENQYNVGHFEREAIAFLDEYFLQKDIAIMVGGTGLYISAICNGVDDFPEVDQSIRHELTYEMQNEGIEKLLKELKQLDPNYYKKVDLNNPHRIIRALEICRGTGKPFSSFQNKKIVHRPFNVIKVGIKWERQVLYERINRRVDLMMDAGLLQEVKSLYSKRHLNALQTVGYREFFDHFDGKTTLEQAIELVKRNTRRYAKRQMTWFRKDKDMFWIKNDTTSIEAIAQVEKAML
ncbi:MAG: tRNA (adenosine(37)-N6)-dimethylallyltransferase MiaA [Saprospiraceae bacterium]|nr:tRNA (adenosine(37)-N6)-dimethylallyltransferase MiaA [Saprospiraceae bacterium]